MFGSARRAPPSTSPAPHQPYGSNPDPPPQEQQALTLSCIIPAGEVQFSASVTLPLAAGDAAVDSALDRLESAAAKISARVGGESPPRTPLTPDSRAAPTVPMDLPFDRRDPATGTVYRKGTLLRDIPSRVLRELLPDLRADNRRTAVAIVLQERGERP